MLFLWLLLKAFLFPVDPVNGSSDSMTHGVTHGVRWDLVASGLCVLVLLVAVLSVSGVMAYHYKERQKEKIRR